MPARQLEIVGVPVQGDVSDTERLELTRRHEWGWLMFATMAEKVFDLARESVRA